MTNSSQNSLFSIYPVLQNEMSYVWICGLQRVFVLDLLGMVLER